MFAPARDKKETQRTLPKVAGLLALVLTLGTLMVDCMGVPEDVANPIPGPSTPPSPVPFTYAGFTGLSTADTIGPTKVKLSWNPATDPTVAAYNIYDVTSLFSPRLVKTVPAPASYVTLTGLNTESLYSFRVRAADSTNKEDENKHDLMAIPYGGIQPTATVIDGSSVSISFTNTTAGADQINIYCKKDAETDYTLTKELTPVSLQLTSTTLTGLAGGSVYTCRSALQIAGFVDNNTATVQFTPIGQADHIAFSTNPGGAAAGAAFAPQPVVTVYDKNGNVVSAGPDSNVNITLTVAPTSPNQGAINGTVKVAAVKGIATFNGLNMQSAGDVILVATKDDTTAKSSYGTGNMTATSNTFTISAGSVSPAKSTITIADNNPGAPSVTGPVVANGSTAYTVTILLADQYGNPISGVKPTFGSSSSADTLSQPTHATDATGTTTGSIYTTVAGSKQLSITSPLGLTADTTTANFVAGNPTKVAFTMQPTNAPAGIADMPQIQVAIQDAQGNTVTTSNASVTLSIFVNPSGGTLSGTVTQAAVNGVATFTGLGIDKTGTGYKLVANSSPLAVAYSNAFNMTAGVPAKIAVSGPPGTLSGNCSTAFTFQLQDLGGNPANATANTPVSLTGLGGGGFYASSTCAGSPVGSTITFASGSNLKTYYFKDNKGESLTITASDPSNVMSAGVRAVAINPSQVALTGPPSAVAGKCSQAFSLNTFGADSNLGSVWTTTPFQITGVVGTSGALYGSPACTGTPLNPNAVYAATGTNTTNIYLLDQKSETLALSVLDGANVISTMSPPVNVTILPSIIALTGPKSVVSGHCSTAFTITLQDSLNNPVAAISDTLLTINGLAGAHGNFYSSNSCGGSTLGSTVLVPANSSSATIYFKDNSAETLNINISDPANQMSTSPTIALGISPSALAVTGPSSLAVNTNVCAGPFTLTTIDGGNNVTAAITPITVAATGAGVAGAFYTSSSCASVTATTGFVFNTGDSAKQFYAMSYAPAVSPQLTLAFSDVANVLSPTSINLQVNPAPAWLGTQGKPSWFATGVAPVAARMDGASSVYTLHFDPTNQFLFVADYSDQRVLKYDYLNQQYVGWIGGFNNAGYIGMSGSNIDPSTNIACINTQSGYTTPGWCVGGQTQANGNNTTGQMYYPTGMADDGTYLFVGQYNGHAVTRYNMQTGAFAGYIGRVSSTPTSAGPGGPGTCTSTAANKPTPGWCMGGANTYSCQVGDGSMCYPRAIAYNPNTNYIYVAQYGSILRYKADTGQFYGWIGMVSTVAPSGPAQDQSNTCATTGNGVKTPGWCLGGTNVIVDPRTSPGGMYQPSGLLADATNDILYVSHDQYGAITKYRMSTGAFIATTNTYGAVASGLVAPRQMSTDGNYLYVADDSRILKMDTSGNIWGWIGKVSNNNSMSNGFGNPSASCSSLVVNADTPGWCLGGSAKYGVGETSLHQSYAVAFDGASSIVTGQGGTFPGIKKWDTTTGTYQGTMGLVGNGPTRWSADYNSAAAFYGYDDSSMYTPMGSYSDGTYLYVVEYTSARVKKIEISTGRLVGWIGGITSTPTGGEEAVCIGANAMSASPGWCLGSFYNPNYIWNTVIPQAADGILYGPMGITGDGTYIYITDNGWHRILKYKTSDGSYQGWIGGIGSPPSGGAVGCSGAAGFTPGWCKGGTPAAGSSDGYLYYPAGIVYVAGNLYVIDRNNHRVSQYNATTGAFNGWIGRINTTPTSGCTPAVYSGYNVSNTGWCKGGTSQATGTAGDLGGGFYFMNNREGIASDGTYLYISNSYNSRVDKFTLGGVYQASTSANYMVYNTPWLTRTSTPTSASLGWTGYYVYGLWSDGTNLYGTGNGNYNVVWKRSLATGFITGWQGAIAPNGSPSAPAQCVGASINTPTWCQGGTPANAYKLNQFSGAAYMVSGDANFVYVSDENSHRLTRLPK